MSQSPSPPTPTDPPNPSREFPKFSLSAILNWEHTCYHEILPSTIDPSSPLVLSTPHRTLHLNSSTCALIVTLDHAGISSLTPSNLREATLRIYLLQSLPILLWPHPPTHPLISPDPLLDPRYPIPYHLQFHDIHAHIGLHLPSTTPLTPQEFDTLHRSTVTSILLTENPSLSHYPPPP